MCNEKENKDCGCLNDILGRILMLQKQDFDNETFTGCDKPYLGPTCTSICYNTRPIMLFNCCTGEPWAFPYTLNNVSTNSNVFRIESLDDCCCTCRVLALDDATNTFTSTNDFFTLDLNCVGAIKCLADTYIDLC